MFKVHHPLKELACSRYRQITLQSTDGPVMPVNYEVGLLLEILAPEYRASFMLL
jgi:hypothetical protein